MLSYYEQPGYEWVKKQTMPVKLEINDKYMCI